MAESLTKELKAGIDAASPAGRSSWVSRVGGGSNGSSKFS